MACNISFDCNNVQPRSAFCFAVSSCPDSSSGTLRCIIDLRQPIPKRSRCRGHNREFKQIATAGATTAAVTEKVWGEYVSAVCQILAK